MNNRRETPSMRSVVFWFALLTITLASSISAQTWIELTPSSGGPSGAAAAIVPMGGGYDPINNRLIVFFGSNTVAEVWVITNANGVDGIPSWTQLTPTGTPPNANGGGSVVYDLTANRLIVYGGCTANCSPALSTVWVLSNANGLGGTPAWATSTVSNPQTRVDHSAVLDEASGLMVAFGGQQAFFGTDQNDIRTLSNANGTSSPSTWSTLAPTGTPPPVRSFHEAAYDTANDRMIIFGGWNLISGGNIPAYDDAWVLANASGTGGTPAWTQLTPLGGPPPARGLSSAVYDDALNQLIVFGGLAVGTPNETFDDVWILRNANGTGGTVEWMMVRQSGQMPGPNYGHVAFFDPVSRRMLVLGGADENGTIHQRLWAMTTPASVPINHPMALATLILVLAVAGTWLIRRRF